MAKSVTPLKDTQIKAAKPEDKQLFDGGGLIIDLLTSGKKVWRYKYSHATTGKKVALTLGDYPALSLQDARKQRTLFEGWRQAMLDPRDQINLKETPIQTFKSVANEWLEKQTHLAQSTIDKAEWLLSFAITDFGSLALDKITPKTVLDTCRKEEVKGHLETARRILSKCSQVFRYCVGEDYLPHDPTRDIKKGQLKPPQVKHRAAITDIEAIPQLLRDIKNYTGEVNTVLLMKLSALLFVRPGELRYAKWKDVDLVNNKWEFTPPKTQNQTKVDLIVPLSSQAKEILIQLQIKSGHTTFVFHSPRTKKHGVISEGTGTQALKRLGYKGEQSMHGFRAIAKTLLRERLGWSAEYTELQLGHAVADVHGRAYNRVELLDDRIRMMQEWADYLDELADDTVIQFPSQMAV